ncbi:Type 1 glutamine amidotransferase-like domain-containing protein, partial [Patescibacteria group bacterium]|nr:Type 1 glutamine amidotransferase-like domain-containing protein [Patescibacteria group bacterium]
NKLKGLVPNNNKTVYISNALDFSDDLERRKESEEFDINQLREVGLEVETLDLRDYFSQPNKLKKDILKYGVIWVRGGNVFVLRQAMKLSGFDNLLKDTLEKRKNLLYGGYSAGICVLAPNLKGLELVDDMNQKPYKGQSDLIWEGLGIINYVIIPHYKSDHPESEAVNKVVKYFEKCKIPFKALRDGEVIIIE